MIVFTVTALFKAFKSTLKLTGSNSTFINFYTTGTTNIPVKRAMVVIGIHNFIL